jgi:Arylsulfotransferase (ASST)
MGPMSRAGLPRFWRRTPRKACLVLLAALVLSGCAVGQSGPATSVGTTRATLNGSVFSGADGTVSYWFDYGTTASYGNQTTHRTIQIGDRQWHDVSQAATGLSPETLYHYRLCARYPGFDAVCGVDRTFTTQRVISQLSIAAQPTLFPDFDPGVSDYVTRCGSDPVTMNVLAPAGTTVAIDGQPPQSGEFTQDVQMAAGQRFSFSTSQGGASATFHVRCLPSNFPAWTFSRTGTPLAPFYITTPAGGLDPEPSRYVAIFDGHGVPLWWYRSDAVDAKVLSGNTLTWYAATAGGTSSPGYEVRGLDGTLVRTWRTVGMETDLHDLQLLGNGNVLMMSYPVRDGTVDLSPYGGPSQNATVVDAEIQEITPGGGLVWSWNTRDHIEPSETGERWWGAMPISTLPDGRRAYDYAHINSAEQTGNVIVASFRHLDAAYAINKTTGDIIWKLGGTTRPESLPVSGDPHEGFPLGGQHHARLLADGTLTLYDNATFLSRPPRAVRYRIDPFGRTAQMLEQITDPEVPPSFCCGSAARTSNGSWLIAWGGTALVTEYGPGGARNFKLTFPGRLTYRVAAIPEGGPTRAELRSGMDAMAPR